MVSSRVFFMLKYFFFLFPIYRSRFRILIEFWMSLFNLFSRSFFFFLVNREIFIEVIKEMKSKPVMQCVRPSGGKAMKLYTIL